MNPQFAIKTDVPVEKTRAEIENLVLRYGASAFSSGWAELRAQIQFKAHDRVVRFNLPLPSKDDRAFGQPRNSRGLWTPARRQRAWEQACRQRWRALLLAIKAKLEAVACDISEFEDEFLANIVDPMTGKTMSEQVRPAIAARYEGRDVPLLALPAPTGGDA